MHYLGNNVTNSDSRPNQTFTERDYALTAIVPFSEYSLRIAIEFFTSTSQYPDVANSLIAINIIKFLGEPLYMKYTCISASTWKLAASSLILGNVAVTSLLQRCTQVMADFCKDWSAAGDLRLPRSRILEIISALQATPLPILLFCFVGF
ncbi:Protein CBG26312 [Caenorhabditis briggsae]|uniref:Protein CBG26312 n=1 Tax=Caenorhabditis briggsae TaxID=6238 RepID=B6IG85_CAEBR|nr:Protein CBG26312 [Caenorhabditis briggsae]CAR98915.1 Protein CBG26312 [Caenorhabditis briggsae]